MKLITLNTWGGRVKELNKDFFDKYQNTDIWCFQEVYKPSSKHDENTRSKVDVDLYNTLQKHLNSHTHDFCQVLDNRYGISTFIDEKIEIIERGETFLARGNWDEEINDDSDHHRKLQWIEMRVNGKKLLVANVHLTHRPVGKGDSEKRLNQSRRIIDFLNMFDCPKILCGDFNLLPDTESIKMIEKAGMRDLVKEYGVTSTRTELYKKEWRFADYIFVSPEIKVNDFKVLPDVVSDHSPLMLDFEL